MSLQRQTGLILLLYTSVVYLTAFSDRISRGAELFSWLDLITVSAAIIMFLCYVKDLFILRIAQVVAILIISIGASLIDSIYIGSLYFSIAFLLAYAYGVFVKHRIEKFMITLGLGCIIALFSKNPEEINDIPNAFLMVATIYVSIFIMFLILKYGNFTAVNINRRLDSLGNEIKALKKNKGLRHERGKET
jgi:hypothetical protein